MYLYFALLAINIYFVVRAYIGYKYKYMPLPSEIDNYFEQLQKYYSNTNHNLDLTSIQTKAYHRIKEYLKDEYKKKYRSKYVRK